MVIRGGKGAWGGVGHRATGEGSGQQDVHRNS